jgi:starch synthase (maltosyl-transferring)
MDASSNDEYVASFQVKNQGFYSYKVEGWVDYLLNWQHGLERKIDDYQHVNSELLEGAELLSSLIEEVSEEEKKLLITFNFYF